MPRRAMHPLVEPVAPEARLLIQIIDVGKVHTRPEAKFDDAHTALDFAFRLWRPSLADTWGDAQTGHEVTKHRVPFGRRPPSPAERRFSYDR